jgi:hypothetical protein
MDTARKIDGRDNAPDNKGLALDKNGLDLAVDMAIAACDGDLRDAIRALVVTTSFLQEELDRCHVLISRGFTRGRLSLFDLP